MTSCLFLPNRISGENSSATKSPLKLMIELIRTEICNFNLMKKKHNITYLSIFIFIYLFIFVLLWLNVNACAAIVFPIVPVVSSNLHCSGLDCEQLS